MARSGASTSPRSNSHRASSSATSQTEHRRFRRRVPARGASSGDEIFRLCSSPLFLPDPVGVAPNGGRKNHLQPKTVTPPPTAFDRRYPTTPTTNGLGSCAILFVSLSSTKPNDPFPFYFATRHPFLPFTVATVFGKLTGVGDGDLDVQKGCNRWV